MKYPQNTSASASSFYLQAMSRSVLLRASIFLCFAFLVACARQGAPTGGAKDTTPPQMDTTASTPNFTTRFDQKKIELKFNEWVVLSEASSQVVVSPPLAKRPEVILKGKTVVVNFDKSEVFRPNTTYTINFGTAVKDFHENNPAKDLRFVFSTGDFIDSLSFKGVVSDAFTNEPVENVSVMLYENFADTAVRKERPYYFSRTDKSGQYEFKNLRSGTFRVVGIEDGDQNLKWDGDGERIGFRDQALRVNDSLRGNVNIKLFKNTPRFRLIGQNTNRYGLAKIGFSTPLNAFETEMLAPAGLKIWPERTSDSLLLWYDLPDIDTAWSLIFKYSMTDPLAEDPTASIEKTDTIQIRKLSREDFLKNHRIIFGDLPQAPAASSGRGKPVPSAPAPVQGTKTLVLAPSGLAPLPFNFPIASFDTAQWQLTVDSNRISAFTVTQDTMSQRRLALNFAWKQGKIYTLSLLPGALTDVWGASNTDTLKRAFNVLAEKQLGTLSLTVEGLHPDTSYVLQILNGNNVEQERRFLAKKSTEKFVFPQMQVATYTARLVTDLNNNGRWDTGDFWLHRQAEPVLSKKLEALRANWELEANLGVEPDKVQKSRQ